MVFCELIQSIRDGYVNNLNKLVYKIGDKTHKCSRTILEKFQNCILLKQKSEDTHPNL